MQRQHVPELEAGRPGDDRTVTRGRVLDVSQAVTQTTAPDSPTCP